VSTLRPSRVSFALASASLAVFSLVYGNFSPGGLLLPDWFPDREALVRGIALAVLAASIGLCISRAAIMSVVAIGAYLAVWALLSVPQIIQGPLSIGAWYGFCEAVTGLAGAVIIYAVLRQGREPQAPTYPEHAVRAARMAFALTCVFYGYSHFAYAQYTAHMVPSWLPAPLTIAYLTGVAHVAAGVGIAIGILPHVAASLEALMMMLFGLLVWAPTFWAVPRPVWATPPQNQWSEVVTNAILAASACVVAASLAGRRRRRGDLSTPPYAAPE
jgi:uncharacterized membrane protein YphA (DoxX/SURF4 family)